MSYIRMRRPDPCISASQVHHNALTPLHTAIQDLGVKYYILFSASQVTNTLV